MEGSLYEFADFEDNKVRFQEYESSSAPGRTVLLCLKCAWMTPPGPRIVDVMINDRVNLAEKHACDEHLNRRPHYERLLQEFTSALSGAA